MAITKKAQLKTTYIERWKNLGIEQYKDIQEETIDVTDTGGRSMETIDGALPVEASVKPGLLRMEPVERLASKLLRRIVFSASENALQ